MIIERWEDHDQLQDGQLVTDAEGKLWKVYKYKSLSDGHVETWLQHWSDEYAFEMGGDSSEGGVYALGDDAPFPLTTVRVVPEVDPWTPYQLSTLCVCGQMQQVVFSAELGNVFAAHVDKAGDPCPGLPLPFPPTVQAADR